MQQEVIINHQLCLGYERLFWYTYVCILITRFHKHSWVWSIYNKISKYNVELESYWMNLSQPSLEKFHFKSKAKPFFLISQWKFSSVPLNPFLPNLQTDETFLILRVAWWFPFKAASSGLGAWCARSRNFCCGLRCACFDYASVPLKWTAVHTWKLSSGNERPKVRSLWPLRRM